MRLSFNSTPPGCKRLFYSSTNLHDLSHLSNPLQHQQLLQVYSVEDSYLNVGSLSLDSWLSIDLRLRQETQARQVLLEVSAQICLCRPQFPVSGACVRSQGAWGCGLMAERDNPQFGELSRDDLLSDVVLPCQTWKQRGNSGIF